MDIVFLEPAESELDEAISYYNGERAGLGDEYLVEVLRALERIASFPRSGHPFSRNTRRCLINRFPYAVIYQVSENSILVIAIAHLHREPGYWVHRLGR